MGSAGFKSIGNSIGGLLGGGSDGINSADLRAQEEQRVAREKKAEQEKFRLEEERRKRQRIAGRQAFSDEQEQIGRVTLGGS